MAASDVIKSYLISLGMEVDDSAMRKFNEAMHKATGVVEKHTSILSSTYAKAGLTVASAIGTIIGSTGVLLNSLAKADLGYQKYALTMMMSVENAKRYKLAMDALGESAENVTWMKEVNQQFRLLLADADKLKLPDDYGDRMKQIRSLEFEFTRLKHTASYALQWIGYEIANNISGEMGAAKKTFQEWNDDLIKNVPKWAKLIADKLMPVFKGVSNLIEGAKKAIEELGRSFSTASDGVAIFVAALAIAFGAAGPFGRALIAIGLITVAVERLVNYLNDPQNTSFEAAVGFEALLEVLNVVASAAIIVYNTLKSIATLGAGIAADWFGDTEGGVDAALKDVGKMWDDFYKNQSEHGAKRQERLALAGTGVKKEERVAANQSGGTYTSEIEAAVNKAAKAHNLDPALIRAVIEQESSYNPNAVGSPTKWGQAKGLMQLLPMTANEMGVGDINNIEQNVMGGAGYLKKLLDRNKGNIQAAITGYHGGQGAWDTYQRKGSFEGQPKTEQYLKDVTRRYEKYKTPSSSILSDGSSGTRVVVNFQISDKLRNQIEIKPSNASLALDAARGGRR